MSRPLRRRTRSALVAGILAASFSVAGTPAIGGVAGAQGSATAVRHVPVPRVVIVVGPAGAATDGYRAQARDAAAVARRFSSDVTELYSPNATWPAVRAALQGASLVIYMGHGNGWPSPYSDTLRPLTQDGFGLNPRMGTGDTAHQYFGESAIGSQIHLAPDAVVLLDHLCYASGNSEPRLPEGSMDDARQRVDDFAAGFVRAGAAAVIADAYASPTQYVAAILGGRQTIDSIWRHAPNANGHAFAFASLRSPGFVAQMDPEHAASGFTRSIVLRAGLTTADVRGGARGDGVTGPGGIASGVATGGTASGATVPSLIAAGIGFAAPTLAAPPVAGQNVALDLPVKLAKRARLPVGLQASVRWTAIDLRILPASPPPPVPPATPVPPAASPRPDPEAALRDGPGDAGPEPLAPAAPPDGLDLIVPEVPGDIIAPAPLKVAGAGFSLPIALPATPGRYRLEVTLFDAHGVAFDSASQALLPTMDVRVTGDVDGAILVAPTMTLTAGSAVELPVRIVNLGTDPWGHAAILDPTGRTIGMPASAAMVVGWWLPSGAALDPTALEPALAPVVTADALVALTVPQTPGVYVLLLDLVTPEDGSLMAAGIGPTAVRITVVTPR